jgi:hypothetical protein
VTIGIASLALCVVGIHQVPTLVPASFAAAAVISAAIWLVRSASVERRRRLTLTAIEAGATADVALATSGIARWFAWLELDAEGMSHRLASGGDDAPPAEIAEACGWANRRRELVRADLSSGRRLVLAAATGAKPRLALVLDRRPAPRVEELCETICVSAATQPGPPSLRLVGEPAHDAGGLSALLVVELGAFDVVRKAAGQLLARRVVTDAERRLRALLRGSDTIRRLDDDSFLVSLQVQSEQDIETVKRRMAEELAAIEMPGRTAPLAPHIRTAGIQDAAEGLR